MRLLQNGGFKFVCENEVEETRVKTLFTKEPGTIQWLKETIQPNDIFWDIGANIGLYSIYAASLMMEGTGDVIAFEPHIFTAGSLLRNVEKNSLRQKVHVMTVALDRCSLPLPFFYSSKNSGMSGSQLGHQRDEFGNEFQPAAVELKYTAIGDDIPLNGPDVVKIDVDGQEYNILLGMKNKLGKVRSLQVEINPLQELFIFPFLEELGFHLIKRHYTANGTKKIKEGGVDPLSIPHNAIFERAA